MSAEVHSVTDVLQRLDDISQSGTPTTVGRLMQAFGTTSFLPMLMVPALLLISPLSGIPFFSSICGLTIALIAGQMVLRRRHVWLPGFIARREVRNDRLKYGVEKLRGLASWLDRHSRRRFRLLVMPPFIYIVQALPVAAGLTIPFLEAIPFSSTLIGAAVLSISISLLARDGLFVVVGCILMTISASIPLFVISKII
ncbi:exopolysaccharide biosynthesis protein [Pseudaestuariivita rosea]|uniref:exopolysaccharide biosynthesis protein n=1 Tax=Pseudaestuariivita rosea TaxID=2763263 RepID=UPI001ABAC0AF|nr:exopolysaccharide biosynthesis protein [Pseudaestuariivita rosea]